MPESESPQLRRERIAGLVTAALVCLALPSVLLMVYVNAGETAAGEQFCWFIGSFVAGGLLLMLYWAPQRAPGFAPLAAIGWLVAVVVSVASGDGSGHWPGWAHGLSLGIIGGAGGRGRRGPKPATETASLFCAIGLGIAIAWWFWTHGEPFDFAGYFLVVVAVGLVGWTWARLFRPLFELSLEPVMWLSYKIRPRGPGVADFPRTGPCIVFANHACWLDPLFVAKILPRPVTAMMTGRFYDLPVIRWLMVSFGTVRVPEKAVKRDAPEIGEAIAALDRGECLVIFPEGYLQRSEEHPLRRFGQGIWQVLRARPNTPVFACWIEGGWGSYMSYCNGRPTKNKRPDFRRRISIAVSASVNIPTDVLSEHLRTRIYLMNLVAAARELLDLPALPPFEMPAKGDEKSDEEPASG